MRLTFTSVDIEQSRLPSLMWMDLIQSSEGLNRTKTTNLSKQEGILSADCQGTQPSSSLIPSLRPTFLVWGLFKPP